MCRRAARPLLLILLIVRLHALSPGTDIELVSGQRGEVGSYRDYQVLRVQVNSNATAELLRNYQDRPGVELWSEAVVQGGLVDLMLSPEIRPQLTDQLTRTGASYTVNIDNVQAVIEQEKSQTRTARIQVRQSLRYGHSLNWKEYHRLAEHYQYMDYIGQQYRGLCEVFSLGTSSEGRDLKGIKCGLGQREIWMDGGIHAREWISPAVVSYLIAEFSERSHHHIDILTNFTLYITPVLNPDGYEYTHTDDRLWRKTRSKSDISKCIGVDANRNFDISWGKSGTSSDPCAITYGGPHPFSEPETRAVRDFVLNHKNKLEMFITFHSYSELLFVPYAYTVTKPVDYDDVRHVAERGVAAIEASSGRRYRIPATTKFNMISGVSDDWAKEVAGVKYTYTFELRDTGRKGFLLPPEEIEPNGVEIAAGVTAMLNELLNKRSPRQDRGLARPGLARQGDRVKTTQSDRARATERQSKSVRGREMQSGRVGATERQSNRARATGRQSDRARARGKQSDRAGVTGGQSGRARSTERHSDRSRATAQQSGRAKATGRQSDRARATDRHSDRARAAGQITFSDRRRQGGFVAPRY